MKRNEEQSLFDFGEQDETMYHPQDRGTFPLNPRSNSGQVE